MNRIIIFAMILFVSATAIANEGAKPKPKLKSETTARVLSFMPLNSPALFYVDRPVRGAIYTVLELSGIFYLALGADALANLSENDGRVDWLGIREIGKAVAISSLLLGSIAYLTPWIHTAVATPDYVNDANEKIKEKAGRVSFAPLLDIREDKNLYGLKFQYKF